MKYLADILTLSRFALATLLIIYSFLGNIDIGTGLIIFAVAELTDAFDGTLAAKYPFPKNKTPRYRKYAATYDMLADALTALAAVLFFILRVNTVAGLVIVVGYGLVALIVEMIVYGKLFGHPDNCSQNSLINRNFPLAKKIIMARRAVYLALIAVMVLWLLYASSWTLTIKITITIIAALIAIFLWFFLAQRRHNISRDAVDIEKSLTKKSKRK